MKKTKRRRASRVQVSYLPGFEAPPDGSPFQKAQAKKARGRQAFESRTKLPFLATIVTPRRAYQVEVGESGMRFVRDL